MGQVVYVGDVIIVNEKENISVEDNREILEIGYPYFVTRLSEYSEAFYVEVYGKEVLMSQSDLEYVELIEIVERYNFNIGDEVIITDMEEIKCIENNLFHANMVYIVSKIIGDEIIISNGSKELWIKGGEIRYIKPYKTKTVKDVSMEEKISNNKSKMSQELIDELLDKKDFIALKEMIESN